MSISQFDKSCYQADFAIAESCCLKYSISDFVNEVYLPWTNSNKLSCRDDELNAKVLCAYFGSKSFIQINPLLVEKFKKDRRDSITRYGRQRKPASVNRELATLSRVF